MEKLLKGLPVYRAVMDDESCGMLRVSLVDDPAVQTSFQAFAKQTRAHLYAVQDEEKRIVRGVLMRADFPIYRRDGRFEYYLVFTAADIRKMAERYLYDGRQNRVNVFHQSDSDVAGVRMRQLFIKEKAAGVDPAGFEDIEDGSLFAEYHVTNDEVWAAIKAGTFRGFSIEVNIEMEPAQMQQTTKHSNMRLKKFLQKVMVQFGAVTTDKGVLIWDSDDDLKEGFAVYREEDGERKPAEDGDYKTEDGKVIKVEGGKVAEIADPRAEVEAAEDNPADEAEPARDAKNQEDELWAMFNRINERVEALEGEVATLKKEKGEMADQLAKMGRQPAAPSAHEAFRESEQAPNTGNERLDRVLRIVSAK